MGASTHQTYKSRQYDKPLSPVSPIESNGENWKYPPIARSHLHGKGTLSKIPLEEVHGKKRLSRPFEQPYPMSTSGQKQASAQAMQANMKRADSYLRQQPVQVPTRTAVPPPLTIPAPTHQSRRQARENPYQEGQQCAERSDRRQKKETRVHKGWDPFKEPRKEREADVHHRDDRRADDHDQDLERQDESWLRSKVRNWKHTNDKEGRRLFFLILTIAVVGGVTIGVYVKLNSG